MASSGRWREDQVLIICPGSQTTLAQLGCGELTTPQHRFPTRVFADEVEGRFRPVRTFRRRRAGGAEKEEEDGAAGAAGGEGREGVDKDGDGQGDEFEWVEDPDSVEGAIYPMVGELRCPCFGPGTKRS